MFHICTCQFITLYAIDRLDERMLDINTTAVVKGTKVAMLHMAKRGGGVIVNTASVAGFLASP